MTPAEFRKVVLPPHIFEELRAVASASVMEYGPEARVELSATLLAEMLDFIAEVPEQKEDESEELHEKREEVLRQLGDPEVVQNEELREMLKSIADVLS